jgi:hypothetical protein
MKNFLLAFAVTVIFVAGPAIARAEHPPAPTVGDAAVNLIEALADLGVTVSLAAIRELSMATEALAKDHIEGEAWRGPAIEPDEYVGGFSLKLYPKGKSQSGEHIKAETFYRVDRNGFLKELEFGTSRR